MAVRWANGGRAWNFCEEARCFNRRRRLGVPGLLAGSSSGKPSPRMLEERRQKPKGGAFLLGVPQTILGGSTLSRLKMTWRVENGQDATCQNRPRTCGPSG